MSEGVQCCRQVGGSLAMAPLQKNEEKWRARTNWAVAKQGARELVKRAGEVFKGASFGDPERTLRMIVDASSSAGLTAKHAETSTSVPTYV